MIVITTPAGQIGRQVLANLLDSGEQLRVIAPDLGRPGPVSARHGAQRRLGGNGVLPACQMPSILCATARLL
jgi:uncharacterized protein YbjT (DUF2867 family)